MSKREGSLFHNVSLSTYFSHPFFATICDIIQPQLYNSVSPTHSHEIVP